MFASIRERFSPFRAAERLAYRMISKLDFVFKAERDPLLRGDILAYAEQQFPREKYPTMWTRIPADLRRSVLWDGRLLNGDMPAELAKRQVTDGVLAEVAVKSARQAAFLCLVVGGISSLFFGGQELSVIRNGGMISSQYPAWASEAGVWLPIVGYYISAAVERFGSVIAAILTTLAPVVLLFPAFWAFGFATGMTNVWEQVSGPYRKPTRDTKLFWKSNLARREMQYRAYCREVEQATTRLKDQPLIPVGVASGVIASRGDVEAPQRGQVIGFDGESIRQHVLVLGGTGSGKTRLIMRPLFNRLMNASWGEGHKIGAYVTDGKGTLWRDLQKSVAHREDVVVLGTDGDQYGMDLTQGMSPLEVSTTFKAVSGQVAGKPSDDFWPESASLLLMHAATVARSLTLHQPTVDEWAEKWRLTPYSLLGIARIASQEDTCKYACRRIREASDILADTLREEDQLDLQDALASADWLENTFLELADNTRSSIVANVNVVLGKLMGAREIAHRFCGGTYERMVDVDHALKGGIVFVNVGETEHGMAGKVVATWLKTRLYILAKRRLITDPEACKTTSCALFCDEAQMLVTTGPDSDSTFHNISRETGVFAVFATQSLAALKQVLGEDACANLINLLRSKIILKTEELSTLDFAVKLAGECMRGWEYENGFFATQTAREFALGNAPRPTVNFKGGAGLVPRGFVANTNQSAIYDSSRLQRIAANAPSLMPGQAPHDSRSIWMNLAQREEDKDRGALVDGVQSRPKIDFDELLLGSGMAFAVIQRAGGDRTDIIDLQADELEAA